MSLSLAAVLIGVAASQLHSGGGKSGGYCESLENELDRSQKFTGPVSCAPAAGSGSGRLANRTELVCSCRTIVNGTERVFNVRRTSK